MVYYHNAAAGDPDYWIPFPVLHNSWGFSVATLTYYIHTGSVGISAISTDGNQIVNPTQSPINVESIRIVAISSSSRKKNPNINWANYSEVKEIFDLKD